ncbi:MAG TPA: Gfo/Idh/MocA family oxidoreductase, partial [Acidobacteriota bacterium]|nr:Gfo/Idh/MocA family oxidoreductase [Acidobacteriota bacterium]
MIKVGVIGYGYWGPNIVRNFVAQPGCQVVSVCDRSAEALARVASLYPAVQLTSDPDDILTSPEIDVVAVVTPVATHYQFARKALENGKHVFVEKPLTTTVRDAEELVELAEKKDLRLMVDHT